MKLNSAARLRIVTITGAGILTAGIGLFSTLHTFNNDIAAVDRNITDVSSVVAANPEAALGAALFQIDNESLDLLLILHSQNGSNTVIRDTSKMLSTYISKADLSNGVQPSISEGTSTTRSYRHTSLKITDNELLFVAADSTYAHATLNSNLKFTFLATLIAIILASIVFSLYIRRVRARDDAEALGRMREFLGDASHELRTPLTVIKGYIEMLSKDQIHAPSDKERAFARVSSEIRRMESLIHDLLLLAELGERAEREIESVNLSELARAHISDFETLNPQRVIRTAIDGNVLVSGNSDYLTRFIQNALTNITRHTPNDAPVEMSLTARGKRAVIVIEDGGAGLPESSYGTQVRILNRFDKSRSRENGGSGLGMSIMSGVIEKLGGTLNLHKSHLGGLALEAELPLA